MPSTWLITGGSSGIGLAIARHILKQGHGAVATTRNVETARANMLDIEASGGHWLRFDYADPNVDESIKDAVEKYKVDVLVNNAAYANVAAVEDTSLDALRAQLECNIIGPVRAIQAAVPAFRSRKSGTIINIGSSVSYVGRPAVGIYGSTKSAMATITEGLMVELAPFGIRTLIVELGRFWTNFGSGAEVSSPSDPYKGGLVDKIVGYLTDPNNKSPGDPTKAAQRIFEIVTGTGMASAAEVQSQTRFLLGKDAFEGALDTAEEWTRVAHAVGDIAKSTDHDE